MHSPILLLAAASLASALPAPEPAPQQLFAGGLPDDKPAVIQDCAVGGNYAGPFKDGEGKYVNSDSIRYNIGKKCWNDYLVVTTTRDAK